MAPGRDADRPAARHARPAVSRRRAGRDGRQPADRAAARPRGRRHDARELAAPASARPDHVLDRWRRGVRAGRAHARRARARVRARGGHARRRRRAARAGRRERRDHRRGAERLGWSGGYLRRNARGCQGSGVCAFGCPTGAKQHAGDAYLAPARAAGALVCTGARAERDRDARPPRRRRRGAHRGRRAAHGRGGRVRGRRRHDPHAAAARRQRPRGGRAGPLGRNLSLHPATAIWGVFDEPVDMARGVPQAYYVDEFATDGIMLEGIAGPPDYLAMSAPLTGDRHRELMLRYRHVAPVRADDLRHRARPRAGRPGAPLIRYDLARATWRRCTRP